MPHTTWITYTVFALLALRTFSIYTDGPPALHDYFWDGISLSLASALVALHALHWWLLGPQQMAEPVVSAPSLDAPLAQLKSAMFAGCAYLGYLFPHRKIAGLLVENHPRHSPSFATHFSLYQAILKIPHFVLAHGLAALIAGYSLSAGEAFTQTEPLASLGPWWLLLCWCIWMYCSSWLVLAGAMVLRGSQPPHKP